MTAAMLSPEDVKFEVLNETTQARLSKSRLPDEFGESCGPAQAVKAAINHTKNMTLINWTVRMI